MCETHAMEDFAGVTLDDLYRVETTLKRTCAYTSSSSRKKRIEIRLLNSSVDHYVSTQMHCTSTFTRHTFPTFKMSACTVTRIDVESVVTVYGNTRICCIYTSACVRGGGGGCTLSLPEWRVHSTPSVFERLEDENIRAPEWLRYYAYRATFDFECWFDTAQLPSDSDEVHWVVRHVPLIVSVASNVLGHEQVQCLVTDGGTNKLVDDMMNTLVAMIDAAYEKMKDYYEDVLEKLAEAQSDWDEKKHAARGW